MIENLKTKQTIGFKVNLVSDKDAVPTKRLTEFNLKKQIQNKCKVWLTIEYQILIDQEETLQTDLRTYIHKIQTHRRTDSDIFRDKSRIQTTEEFLQE